MDYVCPICRRRFPLDAKVYLDHGDEHIIEEIKRAHPQWAEADGICKKCQEYYQKIRKVV